MQREGLCKGKNLWLPSYKAKKYMKKIRKLSKYLQIGQLNRD